MPFILICLHYLLPGCRCTIIHLGRGDLSYHNQSKGHRSDTLRLFRGCYYLYYSCGTGFQEHVSHWLLVLSSITSELKIPHLQQVGYVLLVLRPLHHRNRGRLLLNPGNKTHSH